MESFPLASWTALWLGVLTSLSPCPLATNITAVAYIGRLVGRPRAVLAAGLLYTVGRSAAYLLLCAGVALGLLSIPGLSQFLQRRMNQALGPLLILTGILLFTVDRFTAGGTGRWVASAQRWADKGGVWGAGLLGFVFAASFCPLSAALFFGSLVPLTVSHRSPLLLPSLYGLGTAIPAVILAVTLSVGGTLVARVYNRMSGLEKWGRRLTGGLFILVGVYLTLIHVFGVQF
ncbi:MAG TPA: aromatic aminobenezylarsenical efflux permease ArsG family transporter [Elusimicrobiota bacterium]|nr:aromatic aminobenezylarsenical efflux permease ArsG family transporter [Elusimicrobiota bacterium]